jgi:hypothetical protein
LAIGSPGHHLNLKDDPKMRRQHAIKIALQALENERLSFDRKGAMGVHGAYQDRLLVEAALAAARRLAGQPSTPRKAA